MLRQYGEELIHPVGAAMARADGFEAAGREFDWEVAVVSDRIVAWRANAPSERSKDARVTWQHMQRAGEHQQKAGRL